MTLYAILVLHFGEAEVKNVCENLYFTPYKNERVIEVCESVWQESFPLSYNY